jgi:large repetitive protein
MTAAGADFTIDTEIDQPTMVSVVDDFVGSGEETYIGTVGDFTPTDDQTPTLSGFAEAGSTIKIYNALDSSLLGTTTAPWLRPSARALAR